MSAQLSMHVYTHSVKIFAPHMHGMGDDVAVGRLTPTAACIHDVNHTSGLFSTPSLTNTYLAAASDRVLWIVIGPVIHTCT